MCLRIFARSEFPPSAVCDDSTFLRRVTLDIVGRLPTEKETQEFLAAEQSNKRDELVQRLLKNPGYADFFASKWTPLLKNRRDEASDITANFAFHAWMRDSLLANVPYDQIVRELLAATGTVVGNPPVAWYKRVKDPKEQLEDIAQLFLGVRMQCAQCHHHPFEKWSQDDYYSFAAFFSQIGRKPTGTRGEDMIFHKRGIATAVNVKSGDVLKPAVLGESVGEIAADEDPRLQLADWMSSESNPFFAKALVNRYWKHFFKRMVMTLGALHPNAEKKLGNILELFLGIFDTLVPGDRRIPNNGPGGRQQLSYDLVIRHVRQQAVPHPSMKSKVSRNVTGFITSILQQRSPFTGEKIGIAWVFQ